MASILILSSSPLAVHAIVPMPMDGTMRWGVPGAKEPLGARHTGKALATDTAPLHARPGHGVWHGARDTRRFPSLGRAHLVVQLHVKYLARDTAARTVAFVRRRWAHQCKRHRLHQPHEHAAPRLSAPSPLPPALSQHTVLPKQRAVFSRIQGPCTKTRTGLVLIARRPVLSVRVCLVGSLPHSLRPC